MAPSEKRTVALLAVLALAAGCEGPEARPRGELIRRGSLYLHPRTLEPYSGPIFTTFAHAPHEIEQRASLREGQYHGVYERYFGNRKLSLRETYRGGTRDGPYEWYFESGQLYERGTYANGLLEGPYEAYFLTGELAERGSYRQGRFHGPRRFFLADQLIELVTYTDGRIEGPYRRYTREGELDLEGWLQDGQPCGVWLGGGAAVEYARCGYDS